MCVRWERGDATVDAGNDADSHKLGKPRPDCDGDECNGGAEKQIAKLPDCQTA